MISYYRQQIPRIPGEAPRVPRGGEHRGARHELRAEEHTAERATISVRHDKRAQRGGEHRGARHDFVRYHSLVAFCSSVFIRGERAARRVTPRSASQIPRGGANRGACPDFSASQFARAALRSCRRMPLPIQLLNAPRSGYQLYLQPLETGGACPSVRLRSEVCMREETREGRSINFDSTQRARGVERPTF